MFITKEPRLFGTLFAGMAQFEMLKPSRRVGWQIAALRSVLSGALGITGFMTAPSMAKSLYFIFREFAKGVAKTR